MANSKISALSAQTTVAATDMFVVANSGSTTKKITGANMKLAMGGALIGSSTLGADAASIDIASLPATYTHLRIMVSARGTTAATTQSVLIRVNNDSGANYDQIGEFGNSSGFTGAESFAQTGWTGASNMTAASAPSGVFSTYVVDIPFYSFTDRNKVATMTHARKLGTGGGDLAVVVTTGFWRSSAAISRFSLAPDAGNLLAGSAMYIYGIL